MAEETLQKCDIVAVFNRLRSITTNKVCFDCNAKNPTWSSVTYGVFLCIDCSAVHRGLGVHLTFVRSTQLDTNWTWMQLRNMQMGGNANARKFFVQHNCTTTDAQQKYHSRAAQLYRDKLHTKSLQVMKLHGTQLFIEVDRHDDAGDTSVGGAGEVDFFDQHVSSEFDMKPSVAPELYSDAARLSIQEPETTTTNGRSSDSRPLTTGGDTSSTGGPSVDHVLGSSPPTAAAAGPRKSTIGQRRPAGLAGGSVGGARKLGGRLGAQKLTNKDFSEIERQAEKSDQMRVQAAEAKEKQAQLSAEDKERQLASARLAYQDLSSQQQQHSRMSADRIKTLDPKKAEQVERLGMGFAGSSSVSHSAFSDMTTIEQTGPQDSAAAPYSGSRLAAGADLEDFDLGFVSVSKPSEEDFFGGSAVKSGGGLGGGWGSKSGGGGGWGKSASEDKWGRAEDKWDQSAVEDDDSSSSKWGTSSGPAKSTFSSAKSSAPPRRAGAATGDASRDSCGDQAQKKFGNAKAISSDAYFGEDRPSFESQQNMNRFEGASSISSADYFGTSTGAGSRGGGGGMVQAPDMEDVKESVRLGVTKVAGRISSLATGVMSSLQDRYQ